MYKTDWDLRTELELLHRDFGLVAIKTGTEVEDMGFADIAYLRRLTAGILPLYVKMGGPEARNDMRELVRVGVDGLIAPMIESPYALKKFIQTLQEVLTPAQYRALRRGINLETIDGFRNMPAILNTPEARELHQITAARSDLSGSMELSPDDGRVLEICSVITAHAREHELKVSVGGGIHPGIVQTLLDRVNPDTINTRHMVLDCRSQAMSMGGELVARHLEFEARLYERLAETSLERSEAYASRAQVIRHRNRVRHATRPGHS